MIVGWGTAAACHLAMGAPNGLPSAAEVTDAVRDLRVEVHGLTPATRQEWGVASFAGTDAEGDPIELAVYGRDAADAQWLRKVWRFCIYRDSGPTLVAQPAAAGGARGLPDLPGGARRHRASPRSWRPDGADRPTTPRSSRGCPKGAGSPRCG